MLQARALKLDKTADKYSYFLLKLSPNRRLKPLRQPKEPPSGNKQQKLVRKYFRTRLHPGYLVHNFFGVTTEYPGTIVLISLHIYF